MEQFQLPAPSTWVHMNGESEPLGGAVVDHAGFFYFSDLGGRCCGNYSAKTEPVILRAMGPENTGAYRQDLPFDTSTRVCRKEKGSRHA